MAVITEETKKILSEVKAYGPIRSSELIKKTGLSDKNVYKHLSRLINENLIKKIGIPPKIYYTALNSSDANNKIINSFNTNDLILEHNYIYVSPNGDVIKGIKGFEEWCKKNKFDFNKEENLLIKKLKEVNAIRKHGLISAKKIILSGKKELYLYNIFFSDFYTIDHFGKTKLGQLVYLGKSSQSKELIKEIAEFVKPSIQYLIEKYDIKLICFIPPTIDRRIQFLDELKRNLKIQLPEISAIKIPIKFKIPQKTLRKLEDRIINAESTISINPTQIFEGNILIIDDATGSGATLNETAKKIKRITNNKIKIIGYSVVGSYKGFDVISEV